MKLYRLFLSLILLFCVISEVKPQSNKNFDKGVEAYKKKSYEAAAKNFSKALEQDGNCRDCYIYKTLCFLNIGKHQEAYNTTNEGIKKFPTFGDLYFFRGNILFNANEIFMAQDDANMAIKYCKTDSLIPHSYLLRGAVKLALRNFESAVEDCKKVLEFDSLHLGALTNLALCYSDLNDQDKAIETMKKVIRIDSTYIEGIANLGYLLNLKGQYAEAKKYLDKGIAQKKKIIQPYLLSNRAYSNLKLGDTKAAFKDINESLALKPDNSYAYRNLGLIYLETGEKQKACAAFNEALGKGFTESYGQEVNDLLKQHCTD